MKQFMEENDVGLCIDLNQKDSKIDEWAQNLINLAYQTLPAKNYEVLFNKYFDKDIAVKKYSKIYTDLLGER